MRTPLYDRHNTAGARIVDFAGWEMPVQYAGILQEHKAVRDACGVFDISHMGEFFVEGRGSTAWLDSLLTNNLSKLPVGQAQYTLMPNENGGVIDDLIAYRLGEEKYLLVVNAVKIAEDAAWLQKHATAGVLFEDRSQAYAALAIQGPKSGEVFAKLFGQPMPVERNRVIARDDGSFLVTTGYTGEAGFEWIIPAASAVSAWDSALEAGAAPCGLGARDTLRLEMCYPLNGSDLSPTHTPVEAGLGFFVDLEKGAFPGREALLAQRQSGPPRRLVAIRILDKAPPIRPHYRVFADGAPVSETTSGALSPTLGCGIAMAYLPAALCKPGQALEIEVRDRRFRAEVVKKPFLKKP